MIVCVNFFGFFDLKILDLINILLVLSCIINVVFVGVVILFVVKFIIGK